MPRQVMVMPLAFKASQQQSPCQASCRTAAALPAAGTAAGCTAGFPATHQAQPGRYAMWSPASVFQLQVKPIVYLQIESDPTHCRCGPSIASWRGWVLSMTSGSSRSHPRGNASGPLRRCRVVGERQSAAAAQLVPRHALETTGESILKGILVGIKARVGQQLMADFRAGGDRCGPLNSSAGASRNCGDAEG